MRKTGQRKRERLWLIFSISDRNSDVALVVHIGEHLSNYGIVVLECLGTSCDFTEAHFHILGYAPLRSTLVEFLEDIPSLGNVRPLEGLEKGMYVINGEKKLIEC